MAARELQVSLILSAYDKASRVINTMATKGEARLKAFSKHTEHLGNHAFKVGRESGEIGLVMLEPLNLFVEQAEKAEINANRLHNVFKQVGDRTGHAAHEAEEYAHKLQYKIGVDHNEIEAVEAKLAAFRNISSETARMSGIFNRATNAAFDLASAGFGEAATNAVVLGKALQDPARYVKALARTGIVFTQEEQKKIAALEKSGQLHKAQEMILKRVEGQVKGTARATTTEGAKSKLVLKEMSETVGKLLLPAFNQLVEKFIHITQRVQAWVERNPKLAKTLATIVAAVGFLAIGISVLSFVFGGLMKAMSFASGAGGLFLKLMKAVTYQNAAAGIQAKLTAAATMAQTIATKIATVTMSAFRAVMLAVNAVLSVNPFILIGIAVVGIALLIYRYWDSIKAFFIRVWIKIKEIFWKVLDWVKQWGFLFMGPIIAPVGLIIKYWDKISAFFGQVWESVKAKFTNFFAWISGVPLRMFNAGRNIVKSIADGIRSFINHPIEAVKKMVQKIRNLLPFSPAKEGPLRDIHRIRLVETISESIKPTSMVMAMRRVTTAAVLATQVAAAAPPAGGIKASPINAGNQASSIVVTFSPTIHMTGGGSGSEKNIEKELKAMMPDLVRMIEDAIRKEKRRNY